MGSNIQVQKLLNAFFGNNFNFIIILGSCLYIRKKCDYKRKETLIKVVEYIFKYKMYTYLPMLSLRHLSLKQWLVSLLLKSGFYPNLSMGTTLVRHRRYILVKFSELFSVSILLDILIDHSLLLKLYLYMTFMIQQSLNSSNIMYYSFQVTFVRSFFFLAFKSCLGISQPSIFALLHFFYMFS